MNRNLERKLRAIGLKITDWIFADEPDPDAEFDPDCPDCVVEAGEKPLMMPPDSPFPTIPPQDQDFEPIQVNETSKPEDPEITEVDPNDYVTRRTICPNCHKPGTYPVNIHVAKESQTWVCRCGLTSAVIWFNPEMPWVKGLG